MSKSKSNQDLSNSAKKPDFSNSDDGYNDSLTSKKPNFSVSPTTAKETSLSDPKNFINREISWLEFNNRVLHEATDPRTPLLERLKFMAIFSSNLDEFFMVRVAALKQQVAAQVRKLTSDGRTPGTLEELARLPMI
jgi:polyphosphate kinase